MITRATTCPRRMLEFGGWERKENLDEWESRGDFACCSFCGSLHPDVFMESIQRPGTVKLGPTDKNYKVYVSVEGGTREYKFYFLHLSEEQKHKFIELMNMRPRPFEIDYPGHFYVLPFFIEVVPKEVNDG